MATFDFKNHVFPREVKDILERKIVTDAETGAVVRRGENLPDFDEHLVPQDERSTVLNSVIEALTADENDERWTEDEQKHEIPHSGLIGLAFSGGGIRSATFNLGVLQALQKLGLFKCVDYLSTVSGGGFIGSCISSLLASLQSYPREMLPEDLQFPFRHEDGKPEPAAFRHLRNNANYLAPKGLIDVLRVPLLLLRGIIVNFLIVLPYMLALAFVTYVAFLNVSRLEAFTSGAWLGGAPAFIGAINGLVVTGFLATKILVVLLLFALALYPAAHMFMEKRAGLSDWHRRDEYGRRLSRFALLVGLVFFVELQPIAIGLLQQFRESAWASWAEYGLYGSSVSALFADKLLPYLRSFAGRAGVYLVGLIGFAVFWLIYLNLSLFALEGSSLTSWQDLAAFPGVAAHPYLLGAIALFAYGMLTVDMNFTGIHKFYRDKLSKAYIVGFNTEQVGEGETDGTRSNTPAADEKGKAPQVPDADRIISTDELKLSDLDVTYAPYHLVNVLLNLEKAEEAHKNGRHGDFFIFSKRFIGGELTGYHRLPSGDEAKGSEATEPGSSQEESGPRQEETSGPLDDLMDADPATAIAVSGAAAAPNMGKLTVKPLIFLLAMLNVRLNYWFPNPSVAHSKFIEWCAKKIGSEEKPNEALLRFGKRTLSMPWNRVGPIYLLRELFGNLDHNDRFVNLSDGGHIENLGIYELLRRECRLIIAGDGEADRDLSFAGLAEVMRMALIDFGIFIEIDGLDEIRRGIQHHAIGTIYYRNGRVGKLIYLKQSLLGDNNLRSTLDDESFRSSPYRDDNDLFDDNPYIAHYKKQHPDFPHETTADQFFDEAQFECYRALGYEVAMRTLGVR